MALPSHHLLMMIYDDSPGIRFVLARMCWTPKLLTLLRVLLPLLVLFEREG